MMQGADGIVELVVVKQSEFVVHLGTAWAVVESGFIEVHRTFEVALP
jgi:hypothetical protein